MPLRFASTFNREARGMPFGNTNAPGSKSGGRYDRMGVFNLWNTLEFRRGNDLENQLDFAGLAFHQMRPQLRQDVHLFQRPPRRASFWPDFNPAWLEFDQTFQAEGILHKPQER